jgi:hypothetical protein
MRPSWDLQLSPNVMKIDNALLQPQVDATRRLLPSRGIPSPCSAGRYKRAHCKVESSKMAEQTGASERDHRAERGQRAITDTCGSCHPPHTWEGLEY